MSSAYSTHQPSHQPLSRLDNIFSSLRAFRQAQEDKILTDSTVYTPDSKPRSTQKLVITNKSLNGKDGSDFTKLFDSNVLIVSSDIVGASTWPLALACNFNELSADLSFMESHGSLWRILKRPDSFPGTRIILQSSVRITNDKFSIQFWIWL